MYRRILVPHDGSPFAEQVLPHAVAIARQFNSEVHLLEVIPPPNPALYASDLDSGVGADMALQVIEESQDAARESGRRRLGELAARLGDDGIAAAWAVVDGDPADEIVAYENAHDIDLVAMCTHGRTGILRALVGSVTDAVLRNGGRPVLVVRPQEG